MRLPLAMSLVLLLALPATAAESLVRLQPLPANPAAPTDTPSTTYARGHQVGGIVGNGALVFLPITPGYVGLLASEGTTQPNELPLLGPWTDAFLIQFNAYSYDGPAPEDISGRYGTAVFTLRWGAPTEGDSALIPEPSESLQLEQLGQTSGLWLLAAFPDAEQASAFELSPLRQLRVEHQDNIYIVELSRWDKLKLLSEPTTLPADVGVQGITPVP